MFKGEQKTIAIFLVIIVLLAIGIIYYSYQIPYYVPPVQKHIDTELENYKHQDVPDVTKG